MHVTIGSAGCRVFPPSGEAHDGFAGRDASAASGEGVRESGRDPDAPPDGACWRHRSREECVAFGIRLAADAEARRDTALSIELLAWLHARKHTRGVPHRAFLRKFDASRRWQSGATPAGALARAAAVHHLPLTARGDTAAESFAGSGFFPRLCPAEREWMDAERRARFSYFEVADGGRAGWVLRDFFGSMSGRREIEVARDALRLDAGCSVFARVVHFRGRNHVAPGQWDSTLRAGVLDPALPARTVRKIGRPLRSRGAMVHALFEAWERVAGPLPITLEGNG